MNKRSLTLFVFCTAISAEPAHAYIDPGTGSMIAQSITAAILTAGALVGVFWRSIKNFILAIFKIRIVDTADPDKSPDADPLK